MSKSSGASSNRSRNGVFCCCYCGSSLLRVSSPGTRGLSMRAWKYDGGGANQANEVQDGILRIYEELQLVEVSLKL